ncbi:MAG TPA: M20/M25/M40 family metallo-hydrolase [Longimicrobiaceae bacterium]|nr:M20/M25/M40 family metallo-hydrolase [Longimicrobiaceae bacterium]
MPTNSVRKLRTLLPLLALAACAPAGGGTAAAPAAEIQGERVLRDLSVLAADSMEGRRVGTPGNARARAHLLAELGRMGLEPVGSGYEHPFTFTPRSGGAQARGINLLGKVTGTRWPDRYVVVSAHYDHVGSGRPVDGDSIYNGADDNASGTAALLELARHFRANPPESTVIFAFFDAEEVGLQGARAFVANPPVPRERIALNVNMDMVSRSERGELYAAGAAKWPFLRPYLEQVAARAPVRLLLGHDTPEPTPQDDWTLQSDQGAFHQAGIPFVYFGVEDHPGYHKPSDEVEAVTPEFYVGAVRTIADAVRTLDRGVDEIVRARSAMPAPAQ